MEPGGTGGGEGEGRGEVGGKRYPSFECEEMVEPSVVDSGATRPDQQSMHSEGISAARSNAERGTSLLDSQPGVASTVVQARATGHASASAHTRAALIVALAAPRIVA